MKFTFVAAAMHADLSTQPLQTDVGVYPADEVYSIAKIMKTVPEFYPIFTGDKYNVFLLFTLVRISLVVIDM